MARAAWNREEMATCGRRLGYTARVWCTDCARDASSAAGRKGRRVPSPSTRCSPFQVRPSPEPAQVLFQAAAPPPRGLTSMPFQNSARSGLVAAATAVRRRPAV